MLLEVPFLSMAVCNMMMTPIQGNPIYPDFNLYDIREKCENPFMCYPEDGLKDYLNSGKFKKQFDMLRAGEWKECNMIVHYMLAANY